MKRRKPSNTTIKRRIKEYRCPFCGCRYAGYSGQRAEYPEVYSWTFCANCGKKMGNEDNSPWVDLCEVLNKEKAKSIEDVKRIYKEIFLEL